MKFLKPNFSKYLKEFAGLSSGSKSGGGGRSKLVMPRDTPLLFRDATGKPYAGLVVESAELRASTLTLKGWCIGDSVPTVVRQDSRLYCEVKRNSRLDVVQTLGIPAPLAGPGFEIQAFGADASCRLRWTIVQDGEPQELDIELRIGVPANAEPAVAEARPSIDTSLPAIPEAGRVRVVFDRFVGTKAYGWSVDHEGRPGGRLAVLYGGKTIGFVSSTVPRPDVQEALGLSDGTLGFQAMLGGVLQFFAVSNAFDEIGFSATAGQSGSCTSSLLDALPEVFTFSPLKAFERIVGRPSLGGIRSIRYVDRRNISILFEAGKPPGEQVRALTLELYQEDRAQKSGGLRRVGKYNIPLDGNVVELGAALPSPSDPLLLVATEGESEIVATDCIALPAIFSPGSAGIIEYHGTLSSSASLMDVAAKISRGYVDHCARRVLASGEPAGTLPCRDNTLVLSFVADHHDVTASDGLEAFAAAGHSTAWLGRDGSVTCADGVATTLEEFLRTQACRYVLLMDVRADLRPDFWAVIEKHHGLLGESPELVSWDSLILDVTERPTVYRRTMLLHEAFAQHQLMDVSGCIVSSDRLRATVAALPDRFSSGRLRLQEVFCAADGLRAAHVPVVIDSRRLNIPPVVMERHVAEHVPTLVVPPNPASPRPATTSGVSVVVNFRDGVEQTLKCLSSIRAQEFDAEVEIVLVNNGSLPDSIQSIGQHAVDLFGESSVRFVDYDAPFNHSAQTNLGARAARHEMLLLISNDAQFVSRDALRMACAVAAVPWVATCGFRVVGKREGKLRLQSMGLSLNPRGNLLIGASPLVSGTPPAFALDRTLEVVGNTFAAVVVRKDLYFSLGGLDADVFPISYNDVDFCLRATSAGFRHIVVGEAIVDHVAHGTREIDLDLPVDQRILERMPPISRLSQVGFRSL